MAEGRIKNIVADRYFGFIKVDGQEDDIFFHGNDLLDGQTFEALCPDMRVVFQRVPNPRKPGKDKAVKVRAVFEQKNRDKKPNHRPSANTGREASLLPFGFISVDVDKAVSDSPVLHDGSDDEELFSGELLCTLSCLTPMLVGNWHYPKKEANQEKLRAWGFGNVDDEKTIIEPLRLGDGRVVVPGSSIKGMLRHSLGALLSAPMERVSEHRYTYRPNLAHAGGHARLEVRPAIIRKFNHDANTIAVDVLPKPRSAVFAHDRETSDKLNTGNYASGTQLNETLHKVKVEKDKRLRDGSFKPGMREDLSRPFYYAYKGGIDGSGKLANAFKNGSHVHQAALVREDDARNAQPITISKAVVEAYNQTQKILADNETGHLTHSHPLTGKLKDQGIAIESVQKDIKHAAKLVPNQLIYVEIMIDKGGFGAIRSFGHHYQYRWAYTSSVREKAGHTRACLRPLNYEQAPENAEQKERDIPPSRLSGARLLFGYVHDPDENRIGLGAFKRMAGRIAINHAISEETPQFLGSAENGYCVALRTLGQPRSSAYEFYLQQPEDETRPLATYGDLPDESGGDLKGRKIYRHQSTTIKTDIEASEHRDRRAGVSEAESKQAALARFISSEGSEFKFTVRFARLRKWELGALLAVVHPQGVASRDDDIYAHKLGLGRPLGMGSVKFNIDDRRIRPESATTFEDQETTEALLKQALESLRSRLDDTNRLAWLDSLKFDHQSKKRLGYPGKNNRDGIPEIFGWHSDVRKQYAQNRRVKSPSWRPLHEKIKKLS